MFKPTEICYCSQGASVFHLVIRNEQKWNNGYTRAVPKHNDAFCQMSVFLSFGEQWEPWEVSVTVFPPTYCTSTYHPPLQIPTTCLHIHLHLFLKSISPSPFHRRKLIHANEWFLCNSHTEIKRNAACLHSNLSNLRFKTAMPTKLSKNRKLVVKDTDLVPMAVDLKLHQFS